MTLYFVTLNVIFSPDSSVGKESACNAGDPLGWEDPLQKDRLPTPVFLGFPCGSAGKEYACNAGDLGLIPGLGRSPGEGKGNPVQYSGLEHSVDCLVHGVEESDTTERLSLSLFRERQILCAVTHIWDLKSENKGM